MSDHAPSRGPNAGAASLDDLIQQRRSRYAFSDRPVDLALLRELFEAARWAPSSYNEQPWRYLITNQNEPGPHARLLGTLMAANQAWAKNAPVLVLGIARRDFSPRDGNPGSPNRHAVHDLGQASAQLALAATAHGLIVHQMAGFDPEAARAAFALPDGYDPLTVIAIGYPGDATALPEALAARETGPRQRRPLAEIAFAGAWGSAAFSE